MLFVGGLMIFTVICVVGFFVVVIGVPLAWRYESRHPSNPTDENDFPSSYDPLLSLKCPDHILLPQSSKDGEATNE